MKQRRLTEYDYLTLFPLVRPIEIKAEFGELAHCCSQIRNKYRKLRWQTQARALRYLKREIIAEKPYSIPVAVWKEQMLAELEQAKEEAIAKVWSRLKDSEKHFADEAHYVS